MVIKETIIAGVIVSFLIIATAFAISNPNSDYNPAIPYYRESAPNGIYKQGDLGIIENGVWQFGLCEHGKTVETAWGPLHGSFKVTNSTVESLSLKELTYGGYMINRDSYPDAHRLYIEVKDNIIVGAWVR